LLHKQGLVSFPLTDAAEKTVSSVVSTITGRYFGHEIYATSEEKAVAYLYLLIKDHPFTDGNKRTASLIFGVVCDINGLVPRLGNGNPTLDELAVFIERIEEEDHHRAIRGIAAMLFRSA
jgi:prophage maintenance system killer protein